MADEAIPVRWEDPAELPTLFANQLVVSHGTGAEFYLLFGELFPPLPGATEVKVKPVAKVAISAWHMERMVTILQQNLQNWMHAVKKAQEAADARPTH